MFGHHKKSLENLVDYFKNDVDVVSVILGGSIAKGCERIDSDIDAIVVVTDAKYAALEQENRLSECIYGYCTYEKGYFDIKYTTIEYLEALAERGSEPSRNAFKSSKCVFGENKKVAELIEKIPVFQKQEKNDKMLSFYSAFSLSCGYFWGSSENNAYLRIKAASDIVLFGLRLILQNNEVLFPCHKALLETVGNLENKPEDIVEKANCFISNLTEESKNEFVKAVLDFIDYDPPKDYSEVLTRFVDDNEVWWYKKRPNIAEW
ncbi:MAG: nucleotidyltransferase domain-containing protein [Oscillospiraceae bacterium]|nr:nucleotidyltransferase domain-containing protein [Oscillospiraceae bacterium]